jgi:hypothetical protein
MKKVLVTGDSFAADWTSKGIEYPGWVNLLAEEFDINNIAQAGVGEYKILLQLQSVDLSEYDFIIISHTSHSRIHSSTSFHNSKLHSNCDLIFTDVIDNNLKEAEWFFKYVYDDEYYKFIYNSIRTKINDLVKDKECLHIDSFYTDYDTSQSNTIEIVDLWRNNRGNVNHMSKEANIKLYNQISFHILSYER